MLYDVAFLSNDEKEVREIGENIRRWYSKGKERNKDEAKPINENSTTEVGLNNKTKENLKKKTKETTSTFHC